MSVLRIPSANSFIAGFWPSLSAAGYARFLTDATSASTEMVPSSCEGEPAKGSCGRTQSGLGCDDIEAAVEQTPSCRVTLKDQVDAQILNTLALAPAESTLGNCSKTTDCHLVGTKTSVAASRAL